MRQCVEDEDEEEREEGEDDQSDDVLFVLLPDEEDEGLHRVDEPGEAGRRTTGGTIKKLIYKSSSSFILMNLF